MPTFDYNRASFVQQEYRYAIAEDTTIKAKFPLADEVTIDTNLATTDTATLVNTYFAELKKSALVFTVEIDGVMRPDNLVGSIPTYTVAFPQFVTDSRTFKLARFQCDYLARKTTLTIRG